MDGGLEVEKTKDTGDFEQEVRKSATDVTGYIRALVIFLVSLRSCSALTLSVWYYMERLYFLAFWLCDGLAMEVTS